MSTKLAHELPPGCDVRPASGTVLLRTTMDDQTRRALKYIQAAASEMAAALQSGDVCMQCMNYDVHNSPFVCVLGVTLRHMVSGSYGALHTSSPLYYAMLSFARFHP